MDLSGSNEVSANDVTDTVTEAPAKKAGAAPRKVRDSKSVVPLAHQVVVDRERDSLLT